MQLDRYERPAQFMSAAGDFLSQREAEHNLMLGILSGLERDPDAYDGPPLLAAVSGNDGQIVAAVLRTPPHNLVMSEVDDLAAIPTLVAGLIGDALPGVVGPPKAVRAFADAWTSANGGSWRVGREERIYRLSEVSAPAAGPGAARLADASDRDTIGKWLAEFEREALDEEAEAGMIERALDAWLRGGARRFWLWHLDGRAVSMVGAGGRTPNGVRIGPVYTPKPERGRGYASQLTAWVSQTMLDEGRRFCFLYTDLANPTSNHIYQAMGYQPVTDALMVSFRE
jgi:predicted GNAT family acetyltransferase